MLNIQRPWALTAQTQGTRQGQVSSAISCQSICHTSELCLSGTGRPYSFSRLADVPSSSLASKRVQECCRKEWVGWISQEISLGDRMWSSWDVACRLTNWLSLRDLLCLRTCTAVGISITALGFMLHSRSFPCKQVQGGNTSWMGCLSIVEHRAHTHSHINSQTFFGRRWEKTHRHEESMQNST